ncbi:hypothetical protein like AT3G02090 [Hibiscus trionum]|uniref:Uncharacterized protein n=1 Tax=Hibiscus trionum TaxID=183268 RepID=A0A9W7MUN6_HIBTR|nr:hypothetical protein like AT3G02090 [Hibiscus trionum]
MANKQLLSLARRSHKPPSSFTVVRSSSSAAEEFIKPPPPTAMIYDRIAHSLKSKLQKLEKPDIRFLKYGSPHPTQSSHTHILSLPETKITTLPNGLRVATESTSNSRTATVGLWIDAGSRFESDETNGTAHFLERMIFKGTEKRRSEEEIENMGGHLNGYTCREETAYYAKVMGNGVLKAVDILADMLQNSKLEEGCISRERDAILREVQAGEHTEEAVFDHLHSTAFQYSPLGRSIHGAVANIKTISTEHLHHYIHTHYTTPRMVLAASGAVKHDQIVEKANKLFTKLSSDSTTAKEPATFTGSEVRIINDYVPLAKFAIAFEATSSTDPDSIALMVMREMLGSWNKNAGGGKHMGSELAQRVSINGIAESMMAFSTNYKDTGLFGVYAVAKPDCLGDLSFAIMSAITKLAYRVSEDDVIRARNQLKSSLMLHTDGTSPVAEDIGRQLLTYGRRIPIAELFARIDAVDPSTIKRVANRYFYDRDIAISAIGPIKELPDYNWFRRRTYWNRY